MFLKSRGFTLIELLVVISIIALVSSLVTASVKGAREQAIDSKINSLAYQYILALETFAAENQNYYPLDTSIIPTSSGTGGADIAPPPNGNGVVNVDDLLMVIGSWGPCSNPCPADITGNGTVGVDDLTQVINFWGWRHPVCLGTDNPNSVCRLLNIAGQSTVQEPPQSQLINDSLRPYFGNNPPPASKEVINGTNSNGASYQLHGIVYMCVEPESASVSDNQCPLYYLMWPQKTNRNCAGGIPVLIEPDDIILCIYSNDATYLQEVLGD